MTWSATLLRGADDLDVKPFEPVTNSGVVLVDTFGETGITAAKVMIELASKSTTLGIAIMEGAPLLRYDNPGTGAWVIDTPDLSFGPMLCREISCIEHPDLPDLWKVEFTVSGFGPVMATASTTIGSPQITVGVVSRPRMASAYRANVTPPVDTLDASGDFQRAPWQNSGTDIGGYAVDINTSPVSIPIDQTVITITTVRRWPFQNWAATWVGADLTAETIGLEVIADEWVGARNTVAFMGFPIGSLLFESMEIQPLHHEFKTQTVTFIVDEWHHAQQMPLVNPQFSIPTTPDPVTTMSHATVVLWNQTFWDGFEVAATNPLFSVAEMDYLETVFV